VRPDLWSFGKVIGGGMPVGAFGGSNELMAQLAPEGPVYQAGTLSGNPLATAAGLAVLEQLDADAYDRLRMIAARLADGLTSAFADSGIAAQVPRVGPLVGIFFGDHVPSNYDEAKVSVDLGRYPAFFHGMLDRGIALAPGPYEALFPSLAHSESDIDATTAAAAAVAATMAGA
jgi:glutamate-1-semialdehyde 2,1-aminomutase